VETTFYDTTNLPVAVAISLLVGLSLFTQWGIDSGRETFRRSVKSIVASLAVLAALFAAGLRDPWMVCFAFSAAFAFFVNLEIGLKVARGDPSFLGGKLAHAGLAVFFLGVISTGRYSSSQHLSLELNTPQHVLGYTLTYTGHRPTEDGKFAFDIVAEDGSGRFTLSPLMFDAGEQGVMRNPDIASFLTKDLYISPVSLDDADSRTDGSNGTYTIPKGGTVFMGEVEVKFVKFDMGEHGTLAEGSDMAIGSVLEVTRGNSKETVIPVAVYRENGATAREPSASKLMNADIQLVSMNVGAESQRSTVTVEVQPRDAAGARKETLVVEASLKPFVWLLWGGTIVMIMGFALSLVKRSKES
jgi:cytochrome c-type biogenesis protein CcmF